MKNEELRMKNFIETMRQNTSYIAWTVERLRTLCKARKVLSASTRFFILNSSFFILLSCSIMDDGPDALSLQGGSTAQVAFTLKLDKAQPATRATWGDDYDNQAGEGYENRIDQLQVVLYSTDGNNTAYPLHNLWQETSATQGGGQDTYTFVGSIDTNNDNSPRAGTYKIMVFANCTELTGNEDDLGNLAYTYTYKGESTAPAIPMWGVTTAELTLKPGERQTLTDGIDLLRAVAKVEVQLNDAVAQEGFSLTGVTISTANKQGYCLPAGYANVQNTKELDREEGSPTSFHPIQSSATASNLAFTNDGNGTYTLYLPEYDNGTNAATLSVTVADEDKQTETYTLEFKNYTNGQPTGNAYDIVRNHLYRYTITKIDNGQLTVQHQVMPWDKVTSGITYGDIQCELLPKGGDSDPKDNKGDPEARYCILLRPGYGDSSDELKESGSAGAVFQFKLTEPAGAVWTAHLSNTEVFSFSDSNITVNNKPQKLVSTGIARDDWYYIQINISSGHEWADKAFGRDYAWGKEVEAEHRVVDTYFYITISMNDGQEVELPINPQVPQVDESHFKDNGTYRRFAGTESRIWIRQVPAMKGWEEADLAANIDPTETNNPDEKDNFLWWRVNPYWAH